jgi:hypothetical protein
MMYLQIAGLTCIAASSLGMVALRRLPSRPISSNRDSGIMWICIIDEDPMNVVHIVYCMQYLWVYHCNCLVEMLTKSVDVFEQ